jgi:hypothetical protein
VVTLPADVSDIAVDHQLNKLYVVTDGNRIFQYRDGELDDITGYLPKDQFGSRMIETVAVDPMDPRVVYAAGSRDIYATDAAVVRSRDAGFTWEVLTRNTRTGNDEFGKDGGREAHTLRVHPGTRECWAAGGCYGLWKIGAPDSVPYSLPVIRLNKQYKQMQPGETYQLNVIATYETDTSATWSSRNPARATVDSTGLVTAVSEGTVRVVARLSDGDELSCTFAIKAVQDPTGITPHREEQFLVYPNPVTHRVVHLRSPLPGQAVTVTIFNLQGGLLLRQSFVNGTTIELDPNTFRAGLYLACLESRTARETVKLLLQ